MQLKKHVGLLKESFRGTPVHQVYRVITKLLERVRRGKVHSRSFLLAHPVSLFGRYPSFYYPKLLSICLTTRCNLRCFICRREDFKGEDLPFERLTLLECAIRHASTIDLTGWGECLTYPRFVDTVHYIVSLNHTTNLLQITTNGTLLSRKTGEMLRGHLGRLTISLNAATRETYERDMKGGRFEKTIGNIREFLAAIKTSERRRVSLHFVAHTGNFTEIPDFVRLADSLGIGRVTVGQYLIGMEAHRPFSLLEVKEAYNQIVTETYRLAAQRGVVFSARRFFSEQGLSAWSCEDPVNSCFVGVSGGVSPCCYAGSYLVGNVYEKGFEAVWFGSEYRKLRRHRHLDACRQCSPFIPIDDPRAHFTAFFKEQETPVGEAVELAGDDER